MAATSGNVMRITLVTLGAAVWCLTLYRMPAMYRAKDVAGFVCGVMVLVLGPGMLWTDMRKRDR